LSFELGNLVILSLEHAFFITKLKRTVMRLKNEFFILLFLTFFTFHNPHPATGQDNLKAENDYEAILTGPQALQVITSGGEFCLGEIAMIMVNVDNFNSVAGLHLKLSYNADNLRCEGFTELHPQLANGLSGWIDEAAGVISLEWNSSSPVTFTGPDKIATLLFTTKNPGQGELAWYTGATQSYFTDTNGNPIPAEYYNEETFIYELPNILLEDSKTVCIGESVYIMGIATGNAPPFSYLWTYPDGHTSGEAPMILSVTLADSGNYTLLVTDGLGCADQKTCHLEVTCLAIDENNSDRWVIYPNPGNGNINLVFNEDLREPVISVRNIVGQEVFGPVKVDKVFKNEKICFSLDHLPAGLYFIELITEDHGNVSVKYLLNP
jgi:hypothetical protein